MFIMATDYTQAAILDAIKAIQQKRGPQTAITYQELADITRLGRNTVQRHLSNLDNAGAIARTSSGRPGRTGWGYVYELNGDSM